jgi:hypothetical protein
MGSSGLSSLAGIRISSRCLLDGEGPYVVLDLSAKVLLQVQLVVAGSFGLEFGNAITFSHTIDEHPCLPILHPIRPFEGLFIPLKGRLCGPSHSLLIWQSPPRYVLRLF